MSEVDVVECDVVLLSLVVVDVVDVVDVVVDAVVC